MWEAIRWLALIGLFEIVTFFVIVLFVRLAIRDRKRDLARMASSDATGAMVEAPAPEEPQLVRS
jgi:hypothetical protein